MSKQEAALLASKKACKVNSMPIEQYNLQGEFIAEYTSITEAMKVFRMKSNHISACIKCTRKTAYGYIWKKKDLEFNIDSELAIAS